MKIPYSIIYTDNNIKVCEIDWPAEPGYDRIAQLLEPILRGPIEHVSVLHDHRPHDMFVHEEGRIIGLDRNERATKIYRAYSLSRQPDTEPEMLPHIAGTAVLFHQRIWF